MNESNRRENAVRVVVEVDGNPIGFLELDLDRLWPLINHRTHHGVPVEWIDRSKFESALRASVVKRLVQRLTGQLYSTLGDEIVKAELDIEAFLLKAEAAAQTFGKTRGDIEKVVADSGRTAEDFHNFFWEYLLNDSDVDLKKQWKAARNRPQ